MAKNKLFRESVLKQALLNEGVDIHARSAEGETPLHYAIGGGATTSRR